MWSEKDSPKWRLEKSVVFSLLDKVNDLLISIFFFHFHISAPSEKKRSRVGANPASLMQVPPDLIPERHPSFKADQSAN